MNDLALPDFSKKLGDRLIAESALSRDALERATEVAEAKQEALDVVLVKLGMVSEVHITGAIASLTGVKPLARSDYPQTALLAETLSRRFLASSRCIPVKVTKQNVLLAMANPADDFAASSIAMTCGKPVQRRLGLPSDIGSAIERLYQASGGAAAEDNANNKKLQTIDQLMDRASNAPVITLLNSLMTRAVQWRASDIHIEPSQYSLIVRFRIDGVLKQVQECSTDVAAALSSRIKLLSQLNIAEKRLPQDGRFQMQIEGKEIDMRVSTLPTHYGESIALRILNRDDVSLEINALGFDEFVAQPFIKSLEQRHGLVLVTGPTGSGKTTTLYASMQHLNVPERKLLSVEDPIEYQMPGIDQIQIHTDIGVTFAQTLRSVLRHDPDVLLIGEIRDAETAQTAVQSALTGHIVLSTLHTNDAGSSISRLLDMGIDDYLLASTLNGVLAQRLVRTLCERCKTPCKLDQQTRTLLEKAGLAQLVDATTDKPVYQATGCEHCHYIGYAGRTVIAEYLTVDDSIRQLIQSKTNAQSLQTAARQAGMRSIFTDGMHKVLGGQTTVAEVLKSAQQS